jgi:hypothetical protein
VVASSLILDGEHVRMLMDVFGKEVRPFCYECNQKHGLNHAVEHDLYPTLAGIIRPETGGMSGGKASDN